MGWRLGSLLNEGFVFKDALSNIWKMLLTTVSDRDPKHTCSQSAVRGVSSNDREKRALDYRESRLKSGYDQARGRTRVNIRAAFQRWRELKEREILEADTGVALFFLLDRWITLILLCFTEMICVGFCLNMLVSSSLVSCDRRYARVVYVRVGRRYQRQGWGPVGVWAGLFWCFQISTLLGKKNRLMHL